VIGGKTMFNLWWILFWIIMYCNFSYLMYIILLLIFKDDACIFGDSIIADVLMIFIIAPLMIPLWLFSLLLNGDNL
jgi:hypothetical protein